MIFITIFAYKIVNSDVESPNIVTKIQTMNRITKKSWRWNFFAKMWFIQNHILPYNLSYSEARVLKFGKCMQKKSTKNSQEAEFWIFDFFKFHWIFSDFFKRKTNKNHACNILYFFSISDLVELVILVGRNIVGKRKMLVIISNIKMLQYHM